MYKNKGATYQGNSLFVYVRKSFSFFFDGVAAKKNIFRCAKLNGDKEFRLCGGAEGFAPSTCANF